MFGQDEDEDKNNPQASGDATTISPSDSSGGAATDNSGADNIAASSSNNHDDASSANGPADNGGSTDTAPVVENGAVSPSDSAVTDEKTPAGTANDVDSASSDDTDDSSAGSSGPSEEPAEEEPPSEPATPAEESDSSSSFSSSITPSGDDSLLDIKKEALQDLSPLVDKLDQTPDEKFRTTMMMIQASDDKTLIRRAYDAAKNISDEKARAQALLDIVNEINYFTQPQES